jgi:hypothetical protein
VYGAIPPLPMHVVMARFFVKRAAIFTFTSTKGARNVRIIGISSPSSRFTFKITKRFTAFGIGRLHKTL